MGQIKRFGRLEPVRLQLLWLHQAQFAGYYAASELGYFAAEGVDAIIRPRNTHQTPEEVVEYEQAEIGINWLPSLLHERSHGSGLINIAQLFQRSSMRLVAFKDSGIRGPQDLKGRKVAILAGGNQYEALAFLEKSGLERGKKIILFSEPLENGIQLLLDRQVDAAAVTIYHEYRQILDAGVPSDELVTMDMNDVKAAMLEDGLFAHEGWLTQPGNADLAARFLRASLKGWVYCRDHVEEAVDIVMKWKPEQGRAHQKWMLESVNSLIWPKEGTTPPLGKMEPDRFEETVARMRACGFLEERGIQDAYTHDVWMRAIEDRSEAEKAA
jgi:NitT/TauT family transport system substrate-binding protein